MAGDFYKRLLCEFVLQIGESGFDAGVVDQILVALLVAGVVVRPVARTIRHPRADKRRPENHDAHRDQRRDVQNAQRQVPPFVEIRADMLSLAEQIARAPLGIHPLSWYPSSLVPYATLRPLVCRTNGAHPPSSTPRRDILRLQCHLYKTTC